MLLRAILAVLVLAAVSCKSRQVPVAPPPDYGAPLPPGAVSLREVSADNLPPLHLSPEQRQALEQALRHSQTFLARKGAARFFGPDCGATIDEVRRSVDELLRLVQTLDDAALDRAVRTRFRVMQSVGWDGSGSVLYTGYYTPILDASYTQGGPFQYPIYKRPADLIGGSVTERGKRKLADGSLVDYPDTAEIESSGMLKGQELAWLTDPYEVYIVRIQGSAKLRLPDGKVIDVGYAGTNGCEYRSVGAALVADGTIAKDKINGFTMRQYFRDHPEAWQRYATLNPRYIFFSITSGGPFGSLNVPVTADVTVATNKAIFPPAAPMVVVTSTADARGDSQPYAALRVDQDTGGAMRAPGRADLYMGVGEAAERRACVQEAEGKMFYLLLK